MKNKRIVVALGGNAILSKDASAEAQQAALAKTAKHLATLIKQGNQLIITHGNGPQVGNLLIQQQEGATESNPAMPLDTCVAMTQGSLGYWLQNAVLKELENEGIDQPVATVLTQVIVSEDDPAFDHPAKPIGPFFSESEAKLMMVETDSVYREDAGRGWRKVVPSPKPLTIQEHQVINTLIENNVITIAGGGGGVPILAESYRGVEAVIDKDLASEKIAELVAADMFIILTSVTHVAINYGQSNQIDLGRVTVANLDEYIKDKQFSPGSMLPKVEAMIEFVKACDGGQGIITSLENIGNLDNGLSGTFITLD